MTVRWRYEKATGETVEGPAEEFDSQQEAEDWFAAEWSGLREAGVDAVTLLDGDDVVYGPMSLHEA